MADKPLLQSALLYGAARCCVSVCGDLIYGRSGRSISAPVVSASSMMWLSVRYENESSSLRLFLGTVAAANLSEVQKPQLFSSVEWTNDGKLWRADLSEYISAPPCSATAEIREQLDLDGRWFATLKASLRALAGAPTEREAFRYDLLNRRVTERFGRAMQPRIANWQTVHGDLHWANVTQPQCTILDWESWGRGPAGIDEAFLLCFSQLCPAIAARVQLECASVLMTPDGLWSQLFAIAELLRMIEVYGDHPDLYDPLLALSARVMRCL